MVLEKMKNIVILLAALSIIMVIVGCAPPVDDTGTTASTGTADGAGSTESDSGSDAESDACSTCPQFVSPAPGWCDDGTIIPGEVDDCGCRAPPTCEKNDLASSAPTASEDFASQYCTDGAKVLICGTVVKVTYDSPGKGTEYYKEGEMLSFSCPVIGVSDMTDECQAMMGDNCGEDICGQK